MIAEIIETLIANLWAELCALIPGLPTLAPTLVLGLFIFCLAFYRLKIEKYEDKFQDLSINDVEEKGSTCDPWKIKKISIIYGTETGKFITYIHT